MIKKCFKENEVNNGYRRIGTELRNRSYMLNYKKILRIMSKLNLKCIKFTRKSRKFSTYKGTIGKLAKNLINRRFNTKIPLQKITTDPTECTYYVLGYAGRIHVKTAYLHHVLDMFHRQ